MQVNRTMRVAQLGVVALCAVGVVAQLENCRAPGEYAPGTQTQCDRNTDCEWCERNQFSFDFLCCETGEWIGPHLTNPLLFYMVWNSVPYTIILVLVFELLETLLLTFLGSFDLLFDDAGDYETMAASFIGDVFIQGGLGLLIGWTIRTIFLAPTLVSSKQRARAYDEHGRRRIYIVVYLLALLSYMLAGQQTSSGTRWGLAANTAVQLVFIWIVYPFAFESDRDKRMIWTQLDGTVYGGWMKFGFFFTWGATVLLSHALHFANNQPTFAINEFYQQWVVMIPWAVVLLIIAFGVSVARHDGYSVWTTLGIAAVIGGIVTWGVYQLVDNTRDALIWVGVGVGAVALLFFAIAAFVNWKNVRIPGAPPEANYYAVHSTRKGSRAIFSSGGDAADKPLLDTKATAPLSRFATAGVRRRTVRVRSKLDFE